MDFTHPFPSTKGSLDAEKTTYSRRMYGSERLLAAAAKHVDGYSHIFFGCLADFKSRRMLPSQLIELVKEAWIRTRFDAPWVAQRASKDVEPDSWIHVYETSSQCGFEIAQSWTNETVIWRDELHSLSEWEEIILNAYWKPDDGRFGMEWHIAKAPSGGEFMIMASIAHYLGDGRGLLPVIDLFYRHLRAEIQGGLVPTMTLPWGSEISRLCSSSVDAVDHNAEISKNVTIPQEEPPKHKKFVRPLAETPEWESLPSRQSNINLSRRETSALHTICKHRKVTVTALLNSLCILADVQTALHFPGTRDLKSVHKDFYEAEVYIVESNLADRRYLLSKALPSVTGPGGFGNVVFEVLPTIHSMSDIREIIQICRHGLTSIDTSCDAFWNGLVASSDLAQKANKKCTPKAFVEKEHALDALTSTFDKSIFVTPGISSTSIGKLSALGLFEGFRPSVAGTDPNSPLVLHQMTMGLRAMGPDCMDIMAMMWEYDGEITIHSIASPRWHGDRAWIFYETSVRNSLSKILTGSSRL